MIIVWSGWGFVVPLFAVVGGFLGMTFGVALEPLGLNQNLAMSFGITLGEIAAGFAVFFIARYIESRPGREFIDAATNERIHVGKSAGSFFFIPTRFWAFILPALGLAFAVVGWNAYSKPAPLETAAPPAAVSTPIG